ncbi:hypothetical protein MYAER_1669 [Microcystis aeruginosa NIES-2549]|uniref:Putative restriction endonuclease domain-containing protein n=1 Tax=Microcystis aeruginosa NIES-2549 TaxID=1641812 RepID=A0A0F6U3P1_MICAE|nr:hypothetical protein MYAER_1669 [Microcystis aeruginosa NIES-2549]AOC52411.1 hypothetical protein amyaer_1686 [Microcystis aeruginosa NIES-2481]
MTLREKMREYLENGLQLGWLIDTKSKTVEIYRANQEVEVLHNPTHLSGENILTDFVLDLDDPPHPPSKGGRSK